MTMSDEATSPSRRRLMTLGAEVLAAAAASGFVASPVRGASAERSVDGSGVVTRFETVRIEGVDIFYREAGPKDAPVVLLLHGFPTSSRMYRNLIPLLADRYRVIAPDYPAFGHSAVPARSAFAYTHAHFSEIVDALLDTLQVSRYSMYLMDFGGPIGYRLMLKYPDRVKGVIIQNTPVFGEPTDGPIWGPLFAYWKNPSPENREGIRPSLSPDAVRAQYIAGTRNPSLIDPDNWTIDGALLARPGVDEIMLDLLYDIRSNRQTVADARRFFGTHQRRVMIATGVNDPLFPGSIMKPPADMPDIEFHGIDSGHFALEDKCQEIATLSHDFLGRVIRT
jgi:pimeloyl-ACP methyl ester carboxylesterase